MRLGAGKAMMMFVLFAVFIFGLFAIAGHMKVNESSDNYTIIVPSVNQTINFTGSATTSTIKWMTPFSVIAAIFAFFTIILLMYTVTRRKK